MAAQLGTEHTEHYVRDSEVVELVARMPDLFDEPFADYSQVPSYLVAELARREVRVALSGEGSDELFGGYERYLQTHAAMADAGLDATVHKAVSERAESRRLRPRCGIGWLAPLNHLLPNRFKQVRWGDKLHKLAEVLAGSSTPASPLSSVSATHWQGAEIAALLKGRGRRARTRC